MRQERTGEVVASYFGIDLHKDQITWHFIHKIGSGEIVREYGKISTDRIQEELIPALLLFKGSDLARNSGKAFTEAA